MTSFRFSRMALLGSAAIAALAGTAVQAQDTQLDSTSSGMRYDGAGRLVGVISPDPDGAGPLLFSATRTYYDPAGLIVRVETGELSGWQPNSVAPSNWPGFRILKTERFYYDTLSQRVKAEVAGSDGVTVAVTQTNYDRGGREGCSAVRMNPAAFATTPLSACDLGTAGSNGKDRISRKLYDAAGQLVQVRAGVGTSLEEPYTTYTYTWNGKQQTVIDANGNRAQFEYDSLDRLRRWYFPSTARTANFDGSSATSAVNTAGLINSADYEEYGYDANGNRTSLRKRDGQTITYTIDNLNRVSHKGGATVVGVDYTYDLRGLQLSASFTAGSEGVQATYDGFGRVQSNTSTMGGGSRQLSYGYDNNGNRTRVTHPDANFVTYNYDKLNRPDCILRSTTGDCTAAPAGSMLVDYAYNDRGLPSAMNGAVTTSLGYDNVGRFTSLSNNIAASAWNSSWTFAYNSASQIVSNDRSNDAFAFTAFVNADRPYLTNGLNQYTAAGAASFCYDANGNLTADGASVYRYDAENRLVERRSQGANNANCAALTYTGELKASLRYDPLGRLFQVTSGSGAVTRFLNDGDAMVAEYDGANNLLSRYVHGSDAKRDDPIVWYDGPGFSQANERHLRTDWQGSIVLITDATGSNVNAVNRYDEFGIPNCPIVGGLPDCSQPGANQGRFQYTGQAWIAELGMYYYKARIYSPTLGRFLQTDPIGYKDQVNLYAYTSNDPLNKMDFTGTDMTFIWAQRPNAAELQQFSEQIDQLASTETGAKLLADLYSSDRTVTVVLKTRGPTQTQAKDRRAAGDGRGSDSTVEWNIWDRTSGKDEAGSTRTEPFVNFAHDLDHARTNAQGKRTEGNTVVDFFRTIPLVEQHAVKVENQVRLEHGLKLRLEYFGYTQ